MTCGLHGGRWFEILPDKLQFSILPFTHYEIYERGLFWWPFEPGVWLF
jgi:hypothetical protein